MDAYESPTVETFENVDLSKIKIAGSGNTNCGKGMDCGKGHSCGTGSSCGDGVAEDIGEKIKEKLKEGLQRANELCEGTNESKDDPEIK